MSALCTYFCCPASIGKKSIPSTVVVESSPASCRACSISCGCSNTSPDTAIVTHRTPGHGAFRTGPDTGAGTSRSAGGVAATTLDPVTGTGPTGTELTGTELTSAG